MIIITISIIIIFKFTNFLVPLLFVLFFLYMSWLALICYFYFICFSFFFFFVNVVVVVLFFLFCFSFYFWLNNSFSHMKWLTLVNCLVCLFSFLSWNFRVKIHNLIVFLSSSQKVYNFIHLLLFQYNFTFHFEFYFFCYCLFYYQFILTDLWQWAPFAVA